MQIDISDLPKKKEPDRVEDGDDCEVGNVYWTRKNSYFSIVYRLTRGSAHLLKFKISDGSFYGVGAPMRSIMKREYLVGKVKDFPQAITFNVDWDMDAFKGRKLSI